MSGNRKNFDSLRKELDGTSGRQYWRSLEELSNTKEFQELLHREFPENASEWSDDFSRRNFLKLMGASLALAGLSGCTRQPVEKILPYVRQPEEIIPGKPLYFATAMTLCGAGTGLLVESHMGRPTKIEGNPDHPASLGATDIFAQASVLTLYDPDRSQAITNLGNISSWSSFYDVLRLRIDIEKQRPNPGGGLRILTETVCSPTLADQFKQLLTKLPGARWCQYEPVSRDNAREGSQMAFGQYLETQYRFEKADVILSIDNDFLNTGPGYLRYVRDFSGRRTAAGGTEKMNRLYCVESTPSNTGARADHRLSLRPSEIPGFVRDLCAELGIHGFTTSNSPHKKWISALAKDLRQHSGSGAVLAGDPQPAEVHAMTHAINQALGNTGKTVLYTDPVEAVPMNQTKSLQDLVKEMNSGVVETLIILGGNPVFNAPVDFNFKQALSKIALRIHLGLYEDETSFLCDWHIPETHYLESWSDTRAFDGTQSIVQPLIAPLYGGKSSHELLAAIDGHPELTSYEIVQGYWKTQIADDFDRRWRRALHDGLIQNSAYAPKSVTANTVIPSGNETPAKGLEIVFRPDPSIYDGRYANNGWLQELPKPMTKITWENTVILSPGTAQRLGVQSEDVVDLELSGRSIRGPVWRQPGQAENTVTVHFGYGRARAGRVGTGIGFNAYAMRSSNALWYASGASLKKTGAHSTIACTQNHQLMEGRHLVRSASLHEYEEHPEFAKEMVEAPEKDLTLYPDHKYTGYSWGMAIDLNACVGCNACVVACQSENNIPVVGKEQVIRGREMHWIRIDRYYEGPAEDPEMFHQPVLCMHCENAPCEVVCPATATVHDSEGLNVMVYNRCVGTRYCSNNCPYKVRRFNFFLYSDYVTPVSMMQKNPDVTVRSRGVMEKCTYCLQRINETKIEAEKQDRQVRDGEIQTACQQVCPAQAIVFGNINDPNSRVSKMKAEPLNYGLLEDLNTRPRTTYLAHLRNPNPEIEE